MLHPGARRVFPFAVVLLVVAESACRPPDPPAQAGVSSAVAPDSTLVGTFHIIWGERPAFFVTDDAGRTTLLQLNPELTRTLGGPQTLDRQRVRVGGHPAPAAEDGFIVKTIQKEPAGP